MERLAYLEFVFFLIYSIVGLNFYNMKRFDYLKTGNHIISKHMKSFYFFGLQVNGSILVVAGLVSLLDGDFQSNLNTRILANVSLCGLGILLVYGIGRLLDRLLKPYYGF